MQELASITRTLRWSWVILACAAVASSTIIFIYQMVLLYVASYPLFGQGEPGGGQSARVADLVGGWGARGFFFGLTIFASYWVARRIGETSTPHGVLVGALAAIAVQAIFHFAMPPVYLGEALIYLALGTTGGYVGSVMARNALAGQEALYRASRQISEADDPQTIAAAIGEHLGGPEVSGVALWRAIGESGEVAPTEFEVWTTWDPRTQEAWSSARHLDVNMLSSLTHLRGRRSATLRTDDLTASERAEWERRGVRSAFLMPLTVPGEIPFGILMVAFRNRRRFSKGAVREYFTVGEQAALRLENLRLVGEARTSGRRIGVLEERQRLSREIHDSMKGNFTGIDLLASALLNDVSSDRHPEADARRHHLELIRQAARDGARDSERMVQALRPEAVERRPLHTALGELTERWAEEAGVEAAVTATGRPRDLPSQVEDTLWRVAQEAFLNVRKHARASRVAINLSYTEERVCLDIEDDGVGFDPERKGTSPHPGGGFGFKSMRERVEEIGGTLLVHPTPGKGTRLTVELPTPQVATAGAQARRPLPSTRAAKSSP